MMALFDENYNMELLEELNIKPIKDENILQLHYYLIKNNIISSIDFIKKINIDNNNYEYYIYEDIFSDNINIYSFNKDNNEIENITKQIDIEYLYKKNKIKDRNKKDNICVIN
jgi:hypothetical protein